MILARLLGFLKMVRHPGRYRGDGSSHQGNLMILIVNLNKVAAAGSDLEG